MRTDNVFFPIPEFCDGTVSLNDGGDCRTDPATPGLLKTGGYLFMKLAVLFFKYIIRSRHFETGLESAAFELM